MKKQHALIIAAVVIAFTLLFFFSRKTGKSPEQQVAQPTPQERKEIYNYDLSVCPGKTVAWKMQDPYMRGVVEEGQIVNVTMNFYKCNDLKKGDVVLYRFSNYHDPVVKRVVAAPGDTFKLTMVRDEGWELTVNGKVVRGVKGEPYRFGVPAHKPPLQLAAESRKGKLPPGELIVFSSFPPGDRDGSLFGLANQNDIVGKVEGVQQ